MSEPAGGLWRALLAVQAEAPTLQKSAINPHFSSSYVPLDKLHEVVIPIINRNGLVWVTCPAVAEDSSPALQYRLVHVDSGESIDGLMPLVLDKATPQGQGSAITYSRRYALMAVLGLVSDSDDDGNAASGHGRKAPARKTKTAPKPASGSDFLPPNPKPLKG